MSLRRVANVSRPSFIARAVIKSRSNHDNVTVNPHRVSDTALPRSVRLSYPGRAVMQESIKYLNLTEYTRGAASLSFVQERINS